MREQIDELLRSFAAEQKLPDTYVATARRWFLPLADATAARIRAGDLRVLGVVGTQGSGKSTLASFLELLLTRVYGLKVVSLSLDDFYLTRGERERLARDVHPLLATRGVPGTHDVVLAVTTIRHLLSEPGTVKVPRFDKSRDDRKPESQWDSATGPVDAVILEGWCLAAESEDPERLAAPANRLEAEEDPGGAWRHYVNDCLETDYPRLFRMIDKLILLKAPGFQCVYEWRRQQESKLSRRDGDRVMSEEQLKRFVEHFERITRHCLVTLPQKADLVYELNTRQEITGCYENSPYDR
jgi:D-glycerate 3-kinase